MAKKNGHYLGCCFDRSGCSLVTVISLLCSVSSVFSLPWLNAIASGRCCRFVVVVSWLLP